MGGRPPNRALQVREEGVAWMEEERDLGLGCEEQERGMRCGRGVVCVFWAQAVHICDGCTRASELKCHGMQSIL